MQFPIAPQKKIQLTLQGLDNYPNFIRISLRCHRAQTAENRIVNMTLAWHSQDTGWIAFGHLMGCKYLSSFRGVGWKFILVMAKQKAKQNTFKDLFLKEKKGYNIEMRRQRCGYLSLNLNNTSIKYFTLVSIFHIDTNWKLYCTHPSILI